MDNKSQELGELIADLKLIKEAVSKSGSIVIFLDTRWALKGVLMLAGFMIALFSAAFHYMVGQYGSFFAAPLVLRVIFFVLIGLAWFTIGYMKLNNFLKSARGISEDMTLNKLFDEIYTPQLITVLIPYLAVIVLIVVFLSIRGYELYIVPALAISFGLLFLSMNLIFFLRELYFLYVWLIATGLLILFTVEMFHPLVSLNLTFTAGFILTSLLLYIKVPGSKP